MPSGNNDPVTDVPADPNASTEPPSDDDGAIGWLKRELSGDGSGRVLTTIGRGIGLLAGFALFVFVVGVLAVILTVIAFRDERVTLVIMVALCVPALVASLLTWRWLRHLRATVTQPAEVGHQFQDLLSGFTGRPELRELADQFRNRGDAKRANARRGRLRGAVRTGRRLSAVVGAAEPDPDRHDLLVPLTPERAGRLFASATWSAWGLLLAWVAAITAVVSLVASAF